MSEQSNNSKTVASSIDLDLNELSRIQKAIFEGTNYAIISTDHAGVIRSFNNVASKMLGYAADEVINRHEPYLFHDPQELENRAILLSKELARKIKPGINVLVEKPRLGIAEELEWTYIAKDGHRIPVLVSASPLRNQLNEIDGFLSISIDISEKVFIKRTLQDKELRYRLLFEKAIDGIFLMNKNALVDCNPATSNMFGCAREVILNQPSYRFSTKIQPDGQRSKLKALEKIIAAEKYGSQFFEWRFKRYNGEEFIAEVMLNAINIKAVTHLFATIRDISARKNAEQRLETTSQQLLVQNQNLQLINNLSNQLHGSFSFQIIADRTLNALIGVAGTSYVAVFLAEGEGDELKLMASKGFEMASLQVGESIRPKGGLTARALSKDEIVLSEDFVKDKRLDKKIKEALLESEIRSGLAIPLIYQNEIYGSINLGFQTKRKFTDIERETLEVISHTVSQSLANAHQIKKLERMAHYDSLTGLSNRLFFHRSFEEKVKSEDFSAAGLLLLDLDKFKEINDTLGHHIGDKLLQEIGPRLQALFVNRECIISRLGGDEFTLFIEIGAAKQSIMAVAESVLNCLRKPFDIDSMNLEIDVSIGIAIFPDDGKDSHALLRSADVAMYEAKNMGGGIHKYDRTQDKHTRKDLR